MGSKSPDPGGSGHLIYDKSKKLSSENPGSRFLVMKRIESDDGFKNVCNFLIEKAIETAAGGKVEKCIKIKDGSLLIQTKTVNQAKGLVRLVEIMPNIKVCTEEHRSLNTCKGTIYCPNLKNSSDDTVLQNLKKQKVVGIKRMKRKSEKGELYETGLYILSFEGGELPEYLHIGYERVLVKPYIPQPLRCFNCSQYGHGTQNCKNDKVCLNCGGKFHTNENEKCELPSKCVHCKVDNNHKSSDKNCPKFKKEYAIQKIKVEEKVTMKEAYTIYKQRNPITPQERIFSNVVKTCNCICSCQISSVNLTRNPFEYTPDKSKENDTPNKSESDTDSQMDCETINDVRRQSRDISRKRNAETLKIGNNIIFPKGLSKSEKKKIKKAANKDKDDAGSDSNMSQ